ncbi:copper homeostasis protein CutC [Actinoplanes sp. NPDC051859]|uniref:copper homeostasis protein CutC n=1 Tax=Actinoplanes sp. NPDC051859 TaxID=3363909 RepID=UPI0037AB4D6F
MPAPLLEVIALTAADAEAARRGGADRVELVTDMDRQGLTPAVRTFTAVRSAGLPVRVMLRAQDGYAAGDDAVVRAAAALRDAGAEEFVLGFLDPHGAVDRPAVEGVLAVLDGCRWTFHRAIDHVRDRAAAWRALDGLPGLDYVLTAGSPEGVGMGLSTLCAEADPSTQHAAGESLQPAANRWSQATAGSGADQAPRILAGGGLRPEHLEPLLAAGVDAFHTGSAVRPGGCWDAPVDARLVRAWAERLQRPVADR